MKPHIRRALSLTLIYTVFGLLWISLSDWFISGFAEDAETLTRLQNLKGWLFILVTAAVVWFLATRALGEQAELNARIMHSESRLRSIFENVNDGILIYDLETEAITDTNPKMQQMFGCKHDDVRTLSIQELSSEDPPDNTRTAERHLAAARDGTPSMFEWHVRRPDGSRFWAEVTLRATTICDRTHCLMVVRNVSERKQALERLRLSAEVFENARDGIIITDSTPAIIDANPAFCETTGYPREALFGQDPGFLRIDAHVPRQELAMWQAVMECGYWQGEVEIRNAAGQRLSQMLSISAVPDDQNRPGHYVGVYTDITELKTVQRKLEDLAYYDPLTKLPNRLLFHARVDAAIGDTVKSGRQTAVVYMDLDNFKSVNDSFGHPMGDNLLVEITQRMRSELPENALLAHLAGDEFAVLLTDIDDADEAERLTRSLLKELEKPYKLAGGNAIYISACAGISIYSHPEETGLELIQYAHAALYQAKKLGRRSLHFFTPGLVDQANARIQMEAHLHNALARDEFTLHYQPLVAGPEGATIFGMETLCRWQPPGEAMIPPDRFIPLAEESGLIIPLGKWVIEQACRQLRIWHDAGHEDLVVAVNLSARQFESGDVVTTIRNALDAAQVPGSSLQIELTESLLMGSGAEMMTRLNALTGLGVKLVLDDFGTGYSCLSYLHRMPLDLIKIDRSFITDMVDNDAARELVTAIISMARCLNLDVLAEGIENTAQHTAVAAMGCRKFQGYLFGRPQPATDISALLARIPRNRETSGPPVTR